MKKKLTSEAKILLLDIETSPIEAFVWDIWDQNIPLNMIKKDWSIIAWGAKWLGQDKVFYQDVRGQKNVRDDSKILKGIWKLMDEADIIVTQNGKRFDIPKLNTRFIIHKMNNPSPYTQYDTKQMASKHFSFTSNKLEYLGNVLDLPSQKSKHKKFPGFALWEQCLQNNKEAWDEMKHYNIQDVLALEELFKRFVKWDSGVINHGLYCNDKVPICPSCGSKNLIKKGFKYNKTTKYQVYQCKVCSYKARGKTNLLSKEKRANLLINL